MIQLIYPSDGFAPIIPARKAEDAEGRPARKSGRVEYFPVIESSGLVTGMATRSYCHGGSMLLHPVVHLHILDREGRLYLQKRSMSKDIQPGKWDTAVGGHVNYGESITEALYRESSEELDFTEYNPIHICTYIFRSEIEHEFVSVFAAVGRDFRLTPDLSEVDEGRFWSFKEIEAQLENGIFTPNFVSEFRSIRAQLTALL